jgi:ribonuclease-3
MRDDTSTNPSPHALSSAQPFLTDLEAKLGYSFRDLSLLLRALTHRSFVNEHEGEGLRHNESLEFLGDAVLGFLVSARVFRSYPELTEGALSKVKAFLVSAVNLLRMAETMNLGEHIRISRGEERTGGRKKRAILVDTYEAVIGAVYLDGGIEAVSRCVENQLAEVLAGLDIAHLTYGDFKSALQEKLHDMGRPEPVYRVVQEVGPDHRKTFVVQVSLQDEVVAEAEGRTKKEAQQAAASLALSRLEAWAGRGESGAGDRPLTEG